MRNKGQALIFALILIPLFLAIFGILSRVGGITLAHDQIENHCDKKVLEALAAQAKALEELGSINPTSRVIIDTRRTVDDLIETGAANYYMPWLIPLDKALRQAQQSASRAQEVIKAKGLTQALLVLNSATPRKFRGKINETYQPAIPTYYLKDDDGYENEMGAPLEPNHDFEEKQVIEGRIKIFTEKFLWDWADFTKKDFQDHLRSKNITLTCKSKIVMPRLEDSWSVQLTKPAARLSSNSCSLPH